MKQQGLLDEDATFESMDQVLDGLERTSARDGVGHQHAAARRGVAAAEWNAIREEARTLQPSSLPSPRWSPDCGIGCAPRRRRRTARCSRRRRRSRSRPSVRARTECAGCRRRQWPARAHRTRRGRALLEHYRQTLDEVRQIGYAEYASRQLTLREGRRRAVLARTATLTARLLGRSETAVLGAASDGRWTVALLS
jgi:hypothetical protein